MVVMAGLLVVGAGEAEDFFTIVEDVEGDMGFGVGENMTLRGAGVGCCEAGVVFVVVVVVGVMINALGSGGATCAAVGE